MASSERPLEALLPAVEAWARARHEGAPPSHDISHVERVRALAVRLAREEGADEATVSCAAWLHDSGRTDESSGYGDDHEEISARLAKPLLEGLGAGQRDVERVVHAIRAHRHRRGAEPETIEAKCLFDADKIDSLGAVGVARAYLWLGEHGGAVYSPPSAWETVDPDENGPEYDSMQREWAIKLSRIKDRMHTTSGKRIAAARHGLMERFLSALEAEIGGHA